MPYIKDKRKQALDDGVPPSDVGDLTYVLYATVTRWLKRRHHGPRFFHFALATGALVCTLLEIYRRQIAPYEDKKLIENGEVV